LRKTRAIYQAPRGKRLLHLLGEHNLVATSVNDDRGSNLELWLLGVGDRLCFRNLVGHGILPLALPGAERTTERTTEKDSAWPSVRRQASFRFGSGPV
jgi:hypothetical protein